MAAPFEEWFRSMPFITRAYMAGCCVTTLLVHLEIINPLSLYLNFHLVFEKLEIWRLVTTFLFYDYFSLNFFFHMYFLVRHSRALEEQMTFEKGAGDFAFMLFFGSSLLLLIAYGFEYSPTLPHIMFLGPSLAFMIVYVWARKNPNVRMSFLGLFPFNAPYLPWVILGFGYILGQSPLYDLLGIGVGHIFFYFRDVYPKIRNRNFLPTPKIFYTLFDAPPNRPEARPGGQPWGQGERVAE